MLNVRGFFSGNDYVYRLQTHFQTNCFKQTHTDIEIRAWNLGAIAQKLHLQSWNTLTSRWGRTEDAGYADQHQAVVSHSVAPSQHHPLVPPGSLIKFRAPLENPWNTPRESILEDHPRRPRMKQVRCTFPFLLHWPTDAPEASVVMTLLDTLLWWWKKAFSLLATSDSVSFASPG